MPESERPEYELSQSHRLKCDAESRQKNNSDNLDFLPFNLDVAFGPVNGDCILFMFCRGYNVD